MELATHEASAPSAVPAKAALRPPVNMLMVPPAALEALWPDIERRLGPLFDEYPLESLDDLKTTLSSAQRQCWLCLDGESIAAVAITQITIYPQAKVLELVALAGEGVVERIGEMHEWLAAAAVERGCSILQVIGRRGWGRALRKVGAEPAAVLYRMEIGNGR